MLDFEKSRKTIPDGERGVQNSAGVIRKLESCWQPGTSHHNR